MYLYIYNMQNIESAMQSMSCDLPMDQPPGFYGRLCIDPDSNNFYLDTDYPDILGCVKPMIFWWNNEIQ